MLPLPLLRVRTRKGTVSPIFCSGEDRSDELQLARYLIREFEKASEARERKGVILERIRALESKNDYKLVRGLYALLERRADFRNTAPLDPVYARKMIFEESSKRGLALTDQERRSVIADVASKLGLSTADLEKAMWGDLEENLVLSGFESVGAGELLGWYNLSLIQTMLFNCTKLEFSVKGGKNWKRILRNVKWLRLMYNLQKAGEGSREKKGEGEGENDYYDLLCSLDGPLSLFKLTDRYGTSIAKLLPSILASEKWYLKAWIVRKTGSGRKIFEFQLGDGGAPLLFDPYAADQQKRKKETGDDASLYDSNVEESFATRFEQLDTGWKLVREPDPVIADGKALIPDFMFEKYGRRVYLEIVGFWTKDYLEAKVRKLLSASGREGRGIDMLIAVNEELACAKLSSLQRATAAAGGIITYRGGDVPVKPVLEHLKMVEKEIMEESLDSGVKIDIDGGEEEVIPVAEIARKYSMPEEYALKLLSGNESYLVAGRFLISKIKAHKLEGMLENVKRFVEACSLLAENGIPEPCHAELISLLGYEVVWQDLDASKATIVRRGRTGRKEEE